MHPSARLAAEVRSYCGPAAGPAELLSHWNLDPFVLAPLAAGAMLVWRARAAGNDRIARHGAITLALLAFLYVSPFCAWGSSLFTVRVVHHLALALLVAPLLAAIGARRLVRVPGGATVWTLAAALTMWAWHAPGLYGWAVTSDGGYWLMQASIVATATLFWQRVDAASRPVAIAALLAAMVAMGALGALIAMAPSALYAAHFSTTLAWGLGPLDDQQLAGMVMWAPASAVYLVAALVRVHALAGRPVPA